MRTCSQTRASVVLAFVAVLAISSSTNAQEQQSTQTLFTNVRILDGKSDRLFPGMNVLVVGNKIAKISNQPIPVDKSAKTSVIDGDGRTLMPGLIDGRV